MNGDAEATCGDAQLEAQFALVNAENTRLNDVVEIEFTRDPDKEASPAIVIVFGEIRASTQKLFSLCRTDPNDVREAIKLLTQENRKLRQMLALLEQQDKTDTN